MGGGGLVPAAALPEQELWTRSAGGVSLDSCSDTGYKGGGGVGGRGWQPWPFCLFLSSPVNLSWCSVVYKTQPEWELGRGVGMGWEKVEGGRVGVMGGCDVREERKDSLATGDLAVQAMHP